MTWERLLERVDHRNRRIALRLLRMRPCISREGSYESQQGNSLGRTRSNEPASVLIDENRYVLHRLHVAPTEQRRLGIRDPDLSTRAFGAPFQAVARTRQIAGIFDSGRLVCKAAGCGRTNQKNERKLHLQLSSRLEPTPPSAAMRLGQSSHRSLLQESELKQSDPQGGATIEHIRWNSAHFPARQQRNALSVAIRVRP